MLACCLGNYPNCHISLPKAAFLCRSKIARIVWKIGEMDFCEDPTAMCRVVCPKPHRVAPLRFHIRNDAESKAAGELLGLILRKDEFKAERCATLSSSPPFFFGSPPCRTPNPLVQDAHFGVENLIVLCNAPTDSASQRSAHARQQLGKKQAAVRVEGFDCPCAMT